MGHFRDNCIHLLADVLRQCSKCGGSDNTQQSTAICVITGHRVSTCVDWRRWRRWRHRARLCHTSSLLCRHRHRHRRWQGEFSHLPNIYPVCMYRFRPHWWQIPNTSARHLQAARSKTQY